MLDHLAFLLLDLAAYIDRDVWSVPNYYRYDWGEWVPLEWPYAHGKGYVKHYGWQPARYV